MSEIKEVIMRVNDVSKNFINGVTDNQILNHISIDIYEGDFTVIMGPSGAGKSTLLYAISGMDKISEGEVFYKDKNITKMSENQMASLRSKEFGFVFQQTHLVSYLTLYENILAAGYTNHQNTVLNIKNRTHQLLEEMHISHVKDHLPSQVSGGEAQRAAIARALINQPGIIFADEPTGALDSKSTDQLLDIFDTINDEGQTIVMVTHSTKAASYAKRVLFIRDGEVFHQLYKGNQTNEEMYQSISDTLTLLATGGK